MYTPRAVDLAGLRHEVHELLEGAPPGRPLTQVARALVEYAVRVSVTTLDMDGARRAAVTALDVGATPEQLQEVLTLVSGLGMHTLMEGARDLAELIALRGGALPEVDERRAALRGKLLGTSSYWKVFESFVPGFLDAVLRLSPEAFEGCVSYGAIPARTQQLPVVIKEIVSVAVDALPNHRYLPGLRLHLHNALRSGAGRTEILEALDLAAAAPPPPGVG